MIKLIIFTSLLVSVCNAGGYGGSSGSSGYGSSSTGGGYGGSLGSSSGPVQPVSGFGGGPVTAAVQSSHTVEIRHVNVPMELPQPQIVEVEAGNLPLTIHFKSASSALNVVQTHQPGVAGEAQHTTSEDEPHRLVHEVTKPVIQEVREIITPYRRVIQEIKPVQEEIQTIIAKGEPRPNIQEAYGGGSLSGGYSNSLGSGIKGSGAHYAAAATNTQSTSISSHQRSSPSSTKSTSNTQTSTGAVSYFNDALSGVSFAQAASPVASSSSSSSSSGTKTPAAQSSSGSTIRILEGGNSRSSGLSSINAYKSRA